MRREHRASKVESMSIHCEKVSSTVESTHSVINTPPREIHSRLYVSVLVRRTARWFMVSLLHTTPLFHVHERCRRRSAMRRSNAIRANVAMCYPIYVVTVSRSQVHTSLRVGLECIPGVRNLQSSLVTAPDVAAALPLARSAPMLQEARPPSSARDASKRNQL